MSDNFSRFVNMALRILFVPIIVVTAVFLMRYIGGFNILNLILLIFFTGAFALFYLAMKKGVDKKKLLIITIIFGLIVRLIWVLSLDNGPVSDFLGMYERSELFLQGDYSMFHGTNYYARYPHMTVTVLYFALIRIISSNPIFTLKIINAVLSTLGVFLIYLIVKEVFDSEDKGLWGAFLAAIYGPTIIYSGVYCSENLAMPLYLLSVYLFLLVIKEKKNIWFLLLSALALSIGNLFRMVGNIMVIAYIMYILIYMKKTIIEKSKYIACIIVAFLLPLIIVSGTLKSLGITGYNLWRGCETKWTSILRGSNQDSFGRWNEEDALFIDSIEDDKELEKAIKVKVKERYTKTPAKHLAYFWSRKYTFQWSNGDFGGTYWAQRDANSIKIDLEEKGIVYIQFLYLLVLILVYLGLYNKKQYLNNPKINLFYILFCGYAILCLITESQDRYSYIASWLFVILAPAAFERDGLI